MQYKKIVSGALVVIALLATSFFLQHKKEKELQEQHFKQSIKTGVLLMDAWLAEDKRLVKGLSVSLGAIEYNQTIFMALMRETRDIMKKNSVFAGLADGLYIDTQGYWKPGFEPRTRPWYVDTVASTGATVSGPMYYRDITGREIVWWSVASAILNDGTPLGVVSAEILPETIIEKLEEFFSEHLDVAHHFFIFDRNTGFVIADIQRSKEQNYIQTIFSDVFFKEANEKIKFKFPIESETFDVYIGHMKQVPWSICLIM